MEATSEIDTRSFKPVFIRLETSEEVAKVYAIFNDLRILSALELPGDFAAQIDSANNAAGNASLNAKKWDKAISKILDR